MSKVDKAILAALDEAARLVPARLVVEAFKKVCVRARLPRHPRGGHHQGVQEKAIQERGYKVVPAVSIRPGYDG